MSALVPGFGVYSLCPVCSTFTSVSNPSALPAPMELSLLILSCREADWSTCHKKTRHAQIPFPNTATQPSLLFSGFNPGTEWEGRSRLPHPYLTSPLLNLGTRRGQSRWHRGAHASSPFSMWQRWVCLGHATSQCFFSHLCVLGWRMWAKGNIVPKEPKV